MECDEKVADGDQALLDDFHVLNAIRTEYGDTPPQHRSKTRSIEEACRRNDTQQLRDLAVSEAGLLSDEIRRRVWPLLLGYSPNDETDSKIDAQNCWRSLPRHADEDQVQLDVNRAFIFYPIDQTTKQIESRKEELSDLIIEVLRRQPYLCYFQGYHDICQVFLLVLGQDSSTAVARLSTLRIRDFMLPTLSPALAQLRLIPGIIHTVNPRLYNHLSKTQPFFALSGTLTMYAHDIQEYGDIARLFDVFLARESIFSVYMFAQIVLNRSEELFDTPADEPEMLHSILSKLPKPLNLERLISDTTALLEQHPPERLPGWSKISQSSVLKTARWPEQVATQNLQDGQKYFVTQVKELQWAERREKFMKHLWKKRKPAIILGVGVLVGILSYHMRKSPSIYNFILDVWR